MFSSYFDVCNWIFRCSANLMCKCAANCPYDEREIHCY
uniref:Uncharacterized protein n=1 Tax=Arundo donax TaxID=35708 RepID=A0A0A9G4K5_ARUDO